MAQFDFPSINNSRTNEENVDIIKSYLNDMATSLNIEINELHDKISSLEAQIDILKNRTVC